MKKMLALMTCLSLMLSLPLLAAPQTVRFEAMKKQLAGTPVGDIRAGSTIKLPLITWGGDIATILANGDARKTRQGSIFAKAGLSFELVREDVFANQVKSYMRGESPYLRGTLGMINMASELLAADPRTKPVVVYQ
ncbi:MAG: hypothetical protein ABW108_10940, partial [Candidatus Thiodiazotropha sp. 6PLUC10]